MGQIALPVVIKTAATAFGVFSSIQQASRAEDIGEAQQRAYDMQAENARKIAERNAQIRKDQADYNARRQREQAVQEEAIGLMRAKEVRRQTRLKMSSAQAAGAAGGGAATDVTVLDVIGDIFDTGELEARTNYYEGASRASLLNSQSDLEEYQGKQDAGMIMYEGQTRSNQLSYEGANARYTGSVEASDLRTEAAGSLFESGISVAKKYAPEDMGVKGGHNPGIYQPSGNIPVPQRKPSDAWYGGY